nr:thioredoxin family protein [uncultured Adlercreutzia sp.]
MGLFGKMFGKEEEKSCCDVRIVEVPEGDKAPGACDCGGACDAPTPTGGAVTLTILGLGCKRCHQLNDNALALAARSAKTLNVEYVTDPVAIAEAGIMATPALLVNGKVVSQGKVLTESEIEELL